MLINVSLCIVSGWEDVHCDVDIDECNETDACENGVCSNYDGGYSCDCTGTGYEGEINIV